MTIDPHALNALIDRELAELSDNRVVSHIQSLRRQPTVSMRPWDYGTEGEQYPCWTVLHHPASNTGIAYCEQGFGPDAPWGLVFLGDDETRTSIGMDCSWFTTFLQAYFDSLAVTELPIWRVLKTDRTTGEKFVISDEGEWEATWAKVMALRESDPANGYACDTSIHHQRE